MIAEELWKQYLQDEEFFSEELAEVEKKFQDNMEVVCEEFELVYLAN